MYKNQMSQSQQPIRPSPTSAASHPAFLPQNRPAVHPQNHPWPPTFPRHPSHSDMSDPLRKMRRIANGDSIGAKMNVSPPLNYPRKFGVNCRNEGLSSSSESRRGCGGSTLLERSSLNSTSAFTTRDVGAPKFPTTSSSIEKQLMNGKIPLSPSKIPSCLPYWPKQAPSIQTNLLQNPLLTRLVQPNISAYNILVSLQQQHKRSDIYQPRPPVINGHVDHSNHHELNNNGPRPNSSSSYDSGCPGSAKRPNTDSQDNHAHGQVAQSANFQASSSQDSSRRNSRQEVEVAVNLSSSQIQVSGRRMLPGCKKSYEETVVKVKQNVSRDPKYQKAAEKDEEPQDLRVVAQVQPTMVRLFNFYFL